MGYNLFGNDGRFLHWNVTGWSGLLEQAIEYGWHPTGTKPPDRPSDAEASAFNEAYIRRYAETLRHERTDYTEADVQRDVDDLRALIQDFKENVPFTDEDRAALERTRADWDGNYIENDGQFVTDEDAQNLADALERFLEADAPGAVYHPRHLPAFATAIRDAMPQGAFTIPGQNDEDETVQAEVREFIGFCRAGGFSIC
jgi:hypothetical protein